MLNTTGLRKYVSIVDPALVKVPQDVMTEYGLKRDFVAIEKYFDPVNHPVIYSTIPIPRSIWDRVVMVQPTDDLKSRACFQYGIALVENLPQEDGVRIQFAPSGSTSTMDGEKAYLTDAEMNRFYPAEFLEIGGCIFRRNFFRPTIDVIYQPPPLLVDQWARQVVQYADANRITQATNSEKRSDRDIQPPNETGQGQDNGERK